MVNRAATKRRSSGANPAPASVEPTRARLPLDERRSQLTELAKTLFNQRSYDDISIDDIATAAGISKGLLYHYFPSKRDFYVAGVRAAAQEMIRLTDVSGAEPIDRLRVGLDAYLDYVERNARAYVSLLRSGVGVDAEVAAVVEETRRAMVDRLLAGLGVTQPRASLRLASRGWIGFVEAVSLDWIDRGRDLPRGAVRAMLIAALQSALATATEIDPELSANTVSGAMTGPPPIPARRRDERAP